MWLITLHALPPAMCAGQKGKALETGGKGLLITLCPRVFLHLFYFPVSWTVYISLLSRRHHYLRLSLSLVGKRRGQLEGIDMCIETALCLIFLLVLKKKKKINFYYIERMTTVNLTVVQLFPNFFTSSIWTVYRHADPRPLKELHTKENVHVFDTIT